MKLIIENIEKSFDQNHVLRGASYTFEEGKIYSIIGRNGAGKTTLFSCINRDEPIQGGKILLEEDDGTRRPLKFNDVGLVAASPLLPEFLTGYEFISYFIKLNEDIDISGEEAIDAYFDLVKIDERDRFKLIKYYSYGMKNKLQLLCSMIRNPKIILLDEPLSSFDIIVSHDIKERLVEMKGEHIILMSTHILQLATDISDEIVLLKDGILTGSDDHNLYGDAYEDYLIQQLEATPETAVKGA